MSRATLSGSPPTTGEPERLALRRRLDQVPLHHECRTTLFGSPGELEPSKVNDAILSSCGAGRARLSPYPISNVKRQPAGPYQSHEIGKIAEGCSTAGSHGTG